MRTGSRLRLRRSRRRVPACRRAHIGGCPLGVPSSGQALPLAPTLDAAQLGHREPLSGIHIISRHRRLVRVLHPGPRGAAQQRGAPSGAAAGLAGRAAAWCQLAEGCKGRGAVQARVPFGRVPDYPRQAAGQCLLAHLRHRCKVDDCIMVHQAALPSAGGRKEAHCGCGAVQAAPTSRRLPAPRRATEGAQIRGQWAPGRPESWHPMKKWGTESPAHH